MRDKGLDIFLSVLFGISGITILVLAWTQSVSLSERILTTTIGSVGIIWASIKTLPLVSLPGKIDPHRNIRDIKH